MKTDCSPHYSENAIPGITEPLQKQDQTKTPPENPTWKYSHHVWLELLDGATVEWANTVVRLRARSTGDNLIDERELLLIGKAWLLVGLQVVQAVLLDDVHDLGNGLGDIA